MSRQPSHKLFHAGRLSVITFSTQEATFAIPLEQVHYIEKDVERNIKVDPCTNFNHQVITYRERAIPLYDFCNLTGSTSAAAFSQTLIESLNDAEQQHLTWINTLEESFKKNTPFPLPVNPDQCQFSTWYDSFETDDEELAEVIEKLNQQHHKIHSQTKDLLILRKTDPELAMTRFRREKLSSFTHLMRSFENARERVTASVRPIIVFVDQGNNKISALRLDNIKGIENYGMEDFSSDESNEGIMQKKQEEFKVVGYLRNGNKAPYILINFQPLNVTVQTKT